MHNSARIRLVLVLIAVALAAMVMLSGLFTGRQPDNSSNQQGTVRLTVEFSDGKPPYLTTLPWRSGMTALDALDAAVANGLAVNSQGRGQAAFVQGLGSVENDSAADGKYWLLYVNGKRSNVGAGVCTLQPDDAMIWKFEAYRP